MSGLLLRGFPPVAAQVAFRKSQLKPPSPIQHLRTAVPIICLSSLASLRPVCVCLTVYAIEATFEGLSKRTGIAGVPSTGWQKHGVITRKAIFTCPYISGKKEKMRGVFSLGRSPQPSDCTPFFRPERALHVASLALVVLVPNGRSSLVSVFPCN